MREVKGKGLTIRPIRTMINHATTEVFFENMRVPAEALIGEEGAGFRYILSGMNAERILIARRMHRRRQMVHREGHGICGRAHGVRPPDRPEPRRPVSDRARLYQDRAAELMVREAAALYEAARTAAQKRTWRSSWRPKPPGRPPIVPANPRRLRFRREYDIERKFRETRLYRVAPISTNLVLSYVAEQCSGCRGRIEKSLPFSGLLVVALEQAVAAPMCSCRLADAGARVIKIERPEGDFARGYDDLVHGECSYFVWLNRGKESVVLDLAKPTTRRCSKLCRPGPTFWCRISNQAPSKNSGFRLQSCGANIRGSFAARYPVSATPGHAKRKAYDMLIQAESGLASITGTGEPARVGVSVVDIASGMNAYEAILEALFARERTGLGAEIKISMFDAMADWMTVPLLQEEAGTPPQRMGLAHTSISPYGAIQEPRRRCDPHFHSERPRMAGACREGFGRHGARRQPRFCDQCGARKAPDADRWPGRRSVRGA